MSEAVLVTLITVGLPMLAGAVAVLWKDRKAARAETAEQYLSAISEARKAGREEERAEAYKQAATLALEQKNEEISEIKEDLEEARQWLARLTDSDLPSLRKVIISQDSSIKLLSEAQMTLAESYEVLATEKEARS